MTSNEIFATTPRRIFNSKSQSVDRNGFAGPFVVPQRNEITFDSLKDIAPSTLKAVSHTPSRMVKGRRAHLSNSEQPSRLGRPSLHIRGKEVNANLLEKFKSQNEIKSCLKTKEGSPEKPIKEGSGSDNDLTTSLNTLKNAANAKSVKAFLQSNDAQEDQQPRKKRRAVSFISELNNIEESPVTNDQKMLHMILENQKIIMKKLEELESRLR